LLRGIKGTWADASDVRKGARIREKIIGSATFPYLMGMKSHAPGIIVLVDLTGEKAN
jgi:hypothetical protein